MQSLYSDAGKNMTSMNYWHFFPNAVQW